MFQLKVSETGLGPHSDFLGLYYLQVLSAKLFILLFIEEYAEKNNDNTIFHFPDTLYVIKHFHIY